MDNQFTPEKFKELQEYSEAQFKTIVELTRKIESMKLENDNLKSMLENTVSPITIDIPNLSLTGLTNEQLICETQIQIFKNKASVGELSLEETKKFEVYQKILKDIKLNQKDADKFGADKISDQDLLNVISLDVGKK